MMNFNVYGMTCSACSAAVERAVKKIDGIASVSVNLLTHSMKVDLQPDQVSDLQELTRLIIQAVSKAGYEATRKDGSVWGGNSGGHDPEPTAFGSFGTGDPNSLRDHRSGGESSDPSGARVGEDPLAAEERRMKTRLISSWILLIPLMYLSMGPMIHLPLPRFLSGTSGAASMALSQMLLTLAIVWINRRFFISGFNSLRFRAPNMDTLIALGSGAALLYGAIALYRMQWGLGNQNFELVEHYRHQLYFESAAMILTLITMGKYFESRAKGRTSAAITSLLKLAPETACVVRDGVEEVVPVVQIRVGDLIQIRPGERLPVDGVIVSGETSVDEAALTGESIPVAKTVGSPVHAATINRTGSFRFEATHVGDDTTLAKIIRLVEEASASKAPISRLADRISGVFVPIVIVIALLSLGFWLIYGQGFEFALSMGISVLVISCPCALGLATPVAIMVGTGQGATHGILIKSGEALELAHQTETVVLDKTGTVTEGHPVITDIIPLTTAYDRTSLLKLAVTIEQASEHPLAGAVLEKAKQAGIEGDGIEQTEALPGMGLRAVLGQEVFYAGNYALIQKLGYADPKLVDIIDHLAEEGKTPLIFCSEDKGVLGLLAARDPIKESSYAAIRAFTEMGIETILLTGDHARTAQAIADQLGIKHVIAEVMPQDKAAVVEEIRAKGQKVTMIGDGINDAPALVAADVGIAIGAGTDVAIDSADIVLMKSDLRDAVSAIELSQATLRNIKQNLFWAFFYNVLGIPIAAGVFYLALNWRLNPMIAAAAMSFSSVFVVGNALRLKFFRPRHVKNVTSGLEQIAQTSENTTKDDTTDQANQSAVRTKDDEMKEALNMKKMIKIEGMTCQHCKNHVERALKEVPTVVSVEVDLDAGEAIVTGDTLNDSALKHAVEDAGYTVTSIEIAR